MRALQFQTYGEPEDVLRLAEVVIPEPEAGHIRVRVHACGLNNADWFLCRGLFGTQLPRGVGLDVSGTVTAVGDTVVDVRVGDRVIGVPAYKDYPSAGAAEEAVLDVWTSVPDGLDLVEAAALPMVIETGYRCIDLLGVSAGQTLFVYGAGTMIGFGAVQMALLRGARVIAAAGETFAGRLRALGADVTSYGEGMVERVREIAGGPPVLIFDAGPLGDVLPELVRLSDGDAGRILTVSNHGEDANALGVRDSFGSGLRYDALAEFVGLAARGRFELPIARIYQLDEWQKAMDVNKAGHAHGKLVLLL